MKIQNIFTLLYPSSYINKKSQQLLSNILNSQGLTPIENTEDQDIFIIGFPKSGNTWLNNIVAHLVYGLNYNQSKGLIDCIVTDMHAYKFYKRINNVCYFKSHSLPESKFKKVIYIYRDGRDALLSYYHMNKNLNNDLKLEDYFSKSSNLYPCKWHEHINAWFKNPYNADIIYIKYETLKEDPVSEIKKIANFINCNYTDHIIDYIIEQTSFKSMQQLEKNDVIWKKSKENQGWKDTKMFVRKGEIGGYKSEVSQKLIEEFNDYSFKELKKLYYI